MTMDVCRKRLAILWFAFSGVLFVLFFVQTVFGHWQKPDQAWGWLMPNILPTLSLIISVLVAESIGEKKEPAIANGFLFVLSLCLSSAYLAVLLLTILLQPFINADPMQWLTQGQQLYLAPLQGLTVAALGAFFVKPK